MFISEKEQEILNFLSNKNGSATISEIKGKIFLSEPSVRRYLNSLAKKQLIVRTHGGAIMNYNNSANSNDIPIYIRISYMSDEKKKIAMQASKLLFNGAKIFLDTSSSAFHILPYLKNYSDLLVITNNLKTAIAATEINIKTICLGGDVSQANISCNGYDTIEMLSKYNADILFFSCDALSENGLLTDKSKEMSYTREQYIKNAGIKVLMIDNTKLYKKEWYTICSLKDIDYCFCDIPLPESISQMVKTTVE